MRGCRSEESTPSGGEQTAMHRNRWQDDALVQSRGSLRLSLVEVLIEIAQDDFVE